VNIDGDGHRFTPGADCEPGSFRILVFGGSSAWGWGVVDSAAIPALLQRFWPSAGRGVCVQNLGQLGHVSTQEVIELLRQLQNGNVPDLAIFFDGHNDVHSAANQRIAGVHALVNRTARLFEEQSDTRRGARAIDLIRATATFRLIHQLVPQRDAANVGPEGTPEYSGATADAISPTDIERLADDIVRIYLTNYRTVAALSREFGFSYAFFLQPELSLSAKPRSEEEQAIGTDEVVYVPVLRAVRTRLEAAFPTMPHLYDLADIFDGETDQIFIDHVHFTPDGSEIVVRRIIERLGVSAPVEQPRTSDRD
jgi:lysophospholipase L1-like esterase